MHIQDTTSTRSACNLAINSLDAQVTKFWEVEEVPSVKYLSSSERSCERHFSQTYSRDTNGRYIVRLPFNDKRHELGVSYQATLNRLYLLERRLRRDPQIYEEYSNFLNKYEELGHMTEVPHSDDIKSGHFIPHHPTSFDASAMSSSEVLLNEALLASPNIQDLFSIVTRFRMHRNKFKVKCY